MGQRAIEYTLARLLATTTTIQQLELLAGVTDRDDVFGGRTLEQGVSILLAAIRRRIAAGIITSADRPRGLSRKGGM
jgi:hypothetical protein